MPTGLAWAALYLPDSCNATKRRARFSRSIRSPRRRAPGTIRDFQAERLGGLQVDHQFELCRRLDRQVGRLLAAQNAVDIGRRAAERIDIVRPVGQQAAAFRELPEGYIAGTRCCAASRTISSRCVEVKDFAPPYGPPPGAFPARFGRLFCLPGAPALRRARGDRSRRGLRFRLWVLPSSLVVSGFRVWRVGGREGFRCGLLLAPQPLFVRCRFVGCFLVGFVVLFLCLFFGVYLIGFFELLSGKFLSGGFFGYF